jgi:hypothetical protein
LKLHLFAPNSKKNENDPDKPTLGRRMTRRTLLCALSLGLAWSYFLSNFLLERSLFGIFFRLAYFFPALLASIAVIYSGIHQTVASQFISLRRLTELASIVLVSVLSLLTCDVAYSVYLNKVNPKPKENPQYALASTSRYTVGELYPRLYYPTEKSFYIHKPRFSASGEHYGELYSLDLMKSQTLAKSVFELHPVSILIDEYGFRETTSPTGTEIFSLGDSFTLGWGVHQNEIWVERLEKKLRQPIYNLGVSGLSPKQEFMLLDYILRKKGDRFKIRHLLWMIYEGNDLEENYETLRAAEEHAIRDLFTDTILDSILTFPLKMRDESIISRLQNGQIRLKSSGWQGAANPYTVDGVTLPHPLYRSPLQGYRLFHMQYLQRATKPRSYVMNHPNRPALEEVFSGMASLSKEFQFDVTVLIAPTDSRVYAPQFENFPPISGEPHFINFVADLSRGAGFQTIDLLPLLRPYAEKEMLYFRDDDHWNPQGHEVVAEIVARHLTINNAQH